LVLLCGSAPHCHLAAWSAYYIEFHTLLHHLFTRISYPKCLSKRRIKSDNAMPLLRFLFRIVSV